MFFGDWLHEDRTKQRFRSVASPTLKCEAPVLFDVDVSSSPPPWSFFTPDIFTTLLFFIHGTGFFVSFTVTLSIFLLLETPRPRFSPCWGIYLSIYLCYTHTQHVRLHHLENKKNRPNSVHNRNSTLFHSQLCTFLCRTHLSVFGVPPSRSARPQIHGNRGQWRNSHKPHSCSVISAPLQWRHFRLCLSFWLSVSLTERTSHTFYRALSSSNSLVYFWWERDRFWYCHLHRTMNAGP